MGCQRRKHEPVRAYVLHEDHDVAGDDDAPARVGADGDVERAHRLACREGDDVRILRRADVARVAHDLLVERDCAVQRCRVITRERVNLQQETETPSERLEERRKVQRSTRTTSSIFEYCVT